MDYNDKADTYNYDPEYRATEPYFTGHPYDGALNLYYAHNRFYDAQTGQWLSEDPIKDGLNWYNYCGNNPVSYVDVLGLSVENPEEGYYFVMAGSTGGLAFRMWTDGWGLLDEFHNWKMKTAIRDIDLYQYQAAQNKQNYMNGVYDTLEHNKYWQNWIEGTQYSCWN